MISFEDLIIFINKEFKLELDPSNINTESSLKSLGIDSIDFYNIIFELEEKTGLSVSDEDVENMNSIQDILDFFCKTSGSN